MVSVGGSAHHQCAGLLVAAPRATSCRARCSLWALLVWVLPLCCTVRAVLGMDTANPCPYGDARLRAAWLEGWSRALSRGMSGSGFDRPPSKPSDTVAGGSARPPQGHYEAGAAGPSGLSPAPDAAGMPDDKCSPRASGCRVGRLGPGSSGSVSDSTGSRVVTPGREAKNRRRQRRPMGLARRRWWRIHAIKSSNLRKLVFLRARKAAREWSAAPFRDGVWNIRALGAPKGNLDPTQEIECILTCDTAGGNSVS